MVNINDLSKSPQLGFYIKILMITQTLVILEYVSYLYDRKKNANFQLEVSENKVAIFFPD